MKKYIAIARYRVSGYRSMASPYTKIVTKKIGFDTEQEVTDFLSGPYYDDGAYFGAMVSVKIYETRLIADFLNVTDKFEAKRQEIINKTAKL